jgi:hypothetical protein
MSSSRAPGSLRSSIPQLSQSMTECKMFEVMNSGQMQTRQASKFDKAIRMSNSKDARNRENRNGKVLQSTKECKSSEVTNTTQMQSR